MAWSSVAVMPCGDRGRSGRRRGDHSVVALHPTTFGPKGRSMPLASGSWTGHAIARAHLATLHRSERSSVVEVGEAGITAIAAFRAPRSIDNFRSSGRKLPRSNPRTDGVRVLVSASWRRRTLQPSFLGRGKGRG